MSIKNYTIYRNLPEAATADINRSRRFNWHQQLDSRLGERDLVGRLRVPAHGQDAGAQRAM